jgi:hypothetical protein
MHDELTNLLFDLLKWIVLCPGFGWAFTLSIKGLVESFCVKPLPFRKKQCWLYSSALFFVLAAFLHVFGPR